MIMVNIYLNIDESPFSFLTIADDEVLRLSFRPFKWLRYVMFSICGARGGLSEIPNGPEVNCHSTLLPEKLYYNPSGGVLFIFEVIADLGHHIPVSTEQCLFVDHAALNDRITTTDQTPRQRGFTERLVDRDGGCVVTLEVEDLCDAAHLIPRSKGDEYIDRLVRDRSPRYEPPPSISEIDAVENGILLRSDLHKLLGKGCVAFLKTPNYGLEPTDIPRYQLPPARGTDHHITLHQLRKPPPNRNGLDPHSESSHPNSDAAHSSWSNVDVQFQSKPAGLLLPLPPAIILDYIYGVAAYNLWKSTSPKEVHHVMSTYHRAKYAGIPLLPRRSPTTASESEFEDDERRNEELDPTFYPKDSQGDEMSQAMDEMNLILMYASGTTPQELAEKGEKRVEEEERVTQETGRRKVTEWRREMSNGTPLYTDLSSNAAFR
ncbi:hypothetical protein EI94DRAFT_1789091 [Lactarius quietus]|nr:hypothetical protein EI94DRAFT_1789091 [Lactarius quietus]